MNSAHKEVERLLAQILVASNSPAVARASDQISVLCRAYMEPFDDARWKGIHLSPTERRVMDRLFKTPGEIVARDCLLNAMYFDSANEPSPRILDVYMTKLRKKLKGTRYSIPTQRHEYIGGYRGLIAA